jgi:hypothetical protein
LEAGQLGRSGRFTSGDCKQDVRVICGPLPPGAHHTDWAKLNVTNNAGSSSEQKTPAESTETFSRMIVTNKPLPKPSRKQKRKDQDSDDGNGSVSHRPHCYYCRWGG